MARLPFGPDEIRMLSSMLQETGLSEIELESGDARIRIARHMTVQGVAAPATVAALPAEPGIAAAPPSPSVAAPKEDANANAVRSPMAGIAYLTSGPGEPPFVAVGDTVKAGQTLLTVEAMKVFNPIAAPRDGKVTAVLVASNDFVEYDQPLVVLD